MGRVKDSLSELLGKTISPAVVTRNGDSEPRSQLFLVFDDGTSFEFWVDNDVISMASKTDNETLDQVLRLARKRKGSRVHVFDGDKGGELL